VVSNAVKPGRETGAPLVGRQRRPGLEKRLLRQVRGIVVVAAQPPEVSENALVKKADQLGGRRDVSLAGPLAKYFRVTAHFDLLPD
jgi:hypothetical protein